MSFRKHDREPHVMKFPDYEICLLGSAPVSAYTVDLDDTKLIYCINWETLQSDSFFNPSY